VEKYFRNARVSGPDETLKDWHSKVLIFEVTRMRLVVSVGFIIFCFV
jgi:hypothetical protein